jgi:two-component system CheB/CheR fusion protein
MLLGVLLAWLSGHRIAREMAAATRAAEALAEGGAAVVRDSRVTELQRLATALEKSARLLEQRDSERKQAHALEADARRDAEAANHAKDHFLAVLSHELRTPLTPVLTGVALLQKEANLSERGHDYLAMIRRNILVESRLIDDLLDVTRIARGKLEFDRRRVELCTIIERAVEVCRPDIEARRLHFGVDYGPRPYLIEADAARLQQVFWNVLKNAIKFTPRDGCVGIRCRAEDGHVVVQVMDSGIGIEPPDLERIFDAFAQAERSKTRKFGGLGLGLAISKALVEAHGGSIGAQSEGADRGATFVIRLPVLAAGTPRESRPGSKDSTRATEASSRELHVLLVEDHGDTADMTRRVLEIAGHKVKTAGDVTTALDMASRDRFDVLVSDIGLPDGSGVDLMRALRLRGDTLPGIAVSGFGHAGDVESTRSAGFLAHLVKPVDPERLLEALEAYTAA